MPDISISPVPYNSGAISTSYNTTHGCHIDNGLYVHAFTQNNPNYVYVYTTQYSNYNKANAALVRTGTMRAIYLPATATAVRVFRISTQHFLIVVFSGFNAHTYYVGTINISDGSITAEKTTIPGTNTTPWYNTMAAQLESSNYDFSPSAGSYWQCFNPYDFVIYVFDRYVNGGGAVMFNRVQYDPQTKAWTRLFSPSNYNINVQIDTGTGSDFFRFYCQDIPNSTAKLISIRTRVSSKDNMNVHLASTIRYAAIVQMDGTTKIIVTSNLGYQVLCPLSETQILGFTSHSTYQTYNGTKWGTETVTFASGSSRYVIEAIALDSVSFMTLSASDSLAQVNQISAGSTSSARLQIGRVVDATFAQSSPQTAGTTAVGVNAAYAYVDQQILHRSGTDTVQLIRRDSAASTLNRVTILHQPGA